MHAADSALQGAPSGASISFQSPNSSAARFLSACKRRFLAGHKKVLNAVDASDALVYFLAVVWAVDSREVEDLQPLSFFAKKSGGDGFLSFAGIRMSWVGVMADSEGAPARVPM